MGYTWILRMPLFSKKSVIPSIPPAQPMDDFKSVTESLYKQNAEIALKNRTLSLLSKLYEISLKTLEPKELASEMSDIIQGNLGFELVGIFLYDQATDTLQPLGARASARLNESESKYQYFIENAIIPSVSGLPFFRAIFVNKKMAFTENVEDIWHLSSNTDILTKVQNEGHVRSSAVYPLATRDRIIGMLIVSINRPYQELSQHERESIENLVNVIAVALDKALIYEQLRVTNDELEESNKRQEGLIHFISHEIKGFLTKNLAIFASIKEGDYGQATPELQGAAEYGLTDTKKGVETVMDILSASNLKKGTTTFVMIPFDLKESVLSIAEGLKPEAEAKGLQLMIDVGDETIGKVTGDKDQLEKHVFRNLIDNAIKYTPKGEVKVGLKKNGDTILFSVQDSGVGITDEDKKRLFTEGGHGKDSILVNVNSTGYGLFIAKSIVIAHKGRIWAESEGKDKGSTFFVELPAA